MKEKERMKEKDWLKKKQDAAVDERKRCSRSVFTYKGFWTISSQKYHLHWPHTMEWVRELRDEKIFLGCPLNLPEIGMYS